MDKKLNYCIISNRLITGTKNDQASICKKYHTKSIYSYQEREIAINGKCNSTNILQSPSISQNKRLLNHPYENL